MGEVRNRNCTCCLPLYRLGLCYSRRQLFANTATRGLCQPRIPEDRKERSASAVRKRIGPALAIVDNESLDGHGLHCVRGDANSGMADADCGAETGSRALVR
jgi:hypothetical protein